MSPQFVDFNGDGQLDIVTATYDGTPHVAYGSAQGFRQPVRLLDPNGRRITLSRWYDWEAKGYKDDPDQGKGRLTSTLAFDWDADGDYDLLLGDKEDGLLYRRINEGTNAEPKFSGKNLPVLAAGQLLAVPGGLTSPRLVDWDQDGLVDLLCGSYGDAYGDGPGGGVFWYRNVGKPGDPAFAAPVPFIPPSAREAHEAIRPDVGLYVDAADIDRDGDLDLVVGGYSTWKPKERELSSAETERVHTLMDEIKKLESEAAKLREAAFAATENLEKSEATRKMRELYTTPARPLLERQQRLQGEVDALVGKAQRKAFVWLYRNQGGPGSNATR